MASGTIKTLTCQRFHLEIHNGKAARGQPTFTVLLEVTGDDGNSYKLTVAQRNVNTGLMLKALEMMERFWPAYDFLVSVDTSNNRIVGFGM